MASIMLAEVGRGAVTHAGGKRHDHADIDARAVGAGRVHSREPNPGRRRQDHARQRVRTQGRLATRSIVLGEWQYRQSRERATAGQLPRGEGSEQDHACRGDGDRLESGPRRRYQLPAGHRPQRRDGPSGPGSEEQRFLHRRPALEFRRTGRGGERQLLSRMQPAAVPPGLRRVRNHQLYCCGGLKPMAGGKAWALFRRTSTQPGNQRRPTSGRARPRSAAATRSIPKGNAMYPPRSMLASVALSIAALIHPALAADSKTMAGSACHLARGSQPREVYRSSNLIFNLGNAEETVACPAVKDLNKITSAVVRVIDHNPDPNADIFCSLDTLRSNGTQLSRQTLRSSGSSANVQQLSF